MSTELIDFAFTEAAELLVVAGVVVAGLMILWRWIR